MAESITSITTVGTSALTWLITSCGSIYTYLISNPLALLYIGIGLAFTGFSVLRRVIHR